MSTNGINNYEFMYNFIGGDKYKGGLTAPWISFLQEDSEIYLVPHLKEKMTQKPSNSFIYDDNNSEWLEVIPYLYNGTQWVETEAIVHSK
jgi:hypothetical protein